MSAKSCTDCRSATILDKKTISNETTTIVVGTVTVRETPLNSDWTAAVVKIRVITVK